MADEEEHGGKDGVPPYVVFFYYSPGLRTTLVHSPSDPHALINLLPMDTGDSASSASAKSRVLFGEAWKGPRAYRWVQWLAGSQPFPTRMAAGALSPEYSSACLLDRIYVRLRSRRILDQQLGQMVAAPAVLPLDPAAGATLFPDLGSVDKLWDLHRCVDLPSRAELPKDIIFDDYQPPQQQEEATSSVSPDQQCELEGEGAWAGWAQYGAKYVEVTLQGGSSKKLASTKAYFEIPVEYPVRPPRVRLLTGSKKSGSSNNVNACKHIEVEVNAHYDELLGDDAKARDWLFPHQVRRLIMCMNATDNTTHICGGAQRRWGKDRRRSYSLDVQARLLLPR